MSQLAGLATACHPIPSIAVTSIAGLFTAATGRGAADAGLVAVTILASQLSIGWANDYLDRGRDRAAGRIDKPIVAGRVSAGVVRTAALAAAFAFVVLVALHGWPAALAGLIAFGAAGTYNTWAKSTVVSVVPYAVSFGFLPAFVTLGADDSRWPPAWIMAAAALLGGGAHFANVLPDIDGDQMTGVRGLPQRLGRGPSAVVAGLALAAASVVLALGPGTRTVAAGGMASIALAGACVVAVLGQAKDRSRSRLAFLAVVVVALIAVVLLTMSGDAIGG